MTLPTALPGAQANRNLEVLSWLLNIPLSFICYFILEEEQEGLANRKQLPSIKNFPPSSWSYTGITSLSLLTVWLCHHRSDELSWLSGMGIKGRKKAGTKETNIPSICLASSKQGVNASWSPHTGVVSQGQNWWLSRREYRKLSLFRKEDRWGERIVFTLDGHRVLTISTGISPHF